MAKKKYLTTDPLTGKLSRLKAKDLPMIGLKGLDDGDPIAEFGSLTNDIIEYCVYDTEDNYIDSGELEYPLPANLDVGEHVRNLGFERGTYKIVYNFLRQIGGSNRTVLTKRSDKTLWKGNYYIDTNGKIYAGSIEYPELDDDQNIIELLLQDDKYFLQKISPSRTEIRIRPNPAINDPEMNEQFRLLGYSCLSYSDASGESHITFSEDGKTTTINGGSISLTQAMVGGSLIIRDAFVIDYEGTPEVVSRYVPTIETDTSPSSKNFITNGHFADLNGDENGDDVAERTSPDSWPINEIVEFENPGHSKYCLRMTSVGGDAGNQYRMRINDLIVGEAYILSCWVMWTDDWDSLTDQGIFFTLKADVTTSILNYPTHGIVSEEKVINGKTWNRVHASFTAEEDTVYWILGYNNGNTAGYRYFTDIQLEPGSIDGSPSPYMVNERPEEVDTPNTGLITFVDDNKVEGKFSEEDSGFTPLMNGGTLTIKDAYVIDEVFSQDNARIVIDDIPLTNPTATEIRDNGNEGEFNISPYHEMPESDEPDNQLSIKLHADWQYGLVHTDENDNVIATIQSNYKSNWRSPNEHIIPNFGENDKLRLTAHNIGYKAGLLAKISYVQEGTVATYKTGDPPADYTLDENLSTTYATENPGLWNIISEDGDEYVGDVNYIHDYSKDGDHSFWKKSYIHPELRDCTWIWAEQQRNNQLIVWEWQPYPVVNRIWKYWDPNLHSDAVHPEGWSYGFNANHGNPSRRGYNSGWVGHHAKWVQGEGQYGDASMKFIDKNNEFEYPNHHEYNGLYKTGIYTGESSTEMEHRWQGILQRLPHTMASQGLEAGNNITISWWQKSDTPNKGAMVGLYHKKKSDPDGDHYWGEHIGTNPASVGTGNRSAVEYEFLQYRPVSKVGEWEQVSYTGVIEDDWDLTKLTALYVYGMYGPEGILWVENVTIELTTESSEVGTEAVTTDLIAEIDTFVDKNTVILKDTYDNLSPDVHYPNNSANIRSYSVFPNFYVDYISSPSTEEVVYGSLRGEIDSISGTSLTLVNSYAELGGVAGHDFENTLGVGQSSQFDKWFIQAPMDETEDLSKLVRLSPNNFDLISNFKIDNVTYPESPYSVVYKLYEPLPDTVQEKDFVTIVKEMIPPIEETCTLIPFVEEWISDIVLIPPESFDVNSPIGSGQTNFKTYDQLTSTDSSIKEKLENALLSGSLSADINVDHSQFSNFVHFGSVEKRVKNFKYKLDLIEQYTDRSASLSGTSGSASLLGLIGDPVTGAYLLVSGSSEFNPPYKLVSGSLAQIQWWESKRREQINSFDKFEKYMFYDSSSYSSESIGTFDDNSWPKQGGSGTYTYPYILARTSQSSATTWYANQLVSASVYDRANKNRIRGHLPMFIQDDSDNDVFLNFIDMIGHYFDDIWTFIKAMTDVHDRRDKLSEGIAKDLLKPVAQSLGWELMDGKDLLSMMRYAHGMEQSGSEVPWEYSGTAERDISREIWSRVINNMPYFLKTKGTSRAIKGLVNCYGIPSSILRIMEYGGPKGTDTSPDYMLTRKFTKALNFFGASNNTYVQNDTWEPVTLGDGATNRVPDTVEFRFKAVTGSNQVLVKRGDDWAIRLKDNGSVDDRGYVSFMLNGTNGYQEVSSSDFPVYDGDFWSVMLTRTMSGSLKSFVSSDASNLDVDYTLYTKRYDAGRSKIVYESQNTLTISGSLGAISESYNASYTGSSDTITLGGPQHATFGESLSGSMMEYRNWTTALSETAFDNHVAAPIAFDGNHPSASYTDLVTRYSFDDNKDLSVGANQWFRDVSADQSFTSSAVPSGYTSGLGSHFTSVMDQNKMKVPNLGPSRRSSANKIRIEDDVLKDRALLANPILQFGESITVPAYDNAPIDSNKLGLYFSPSAVIDEDIITSMPNLDFDQYIGDPRDQYKERYEGLVTARNLYWQKYSGPNNFWDYLRLLRYYDNSLFKQVKTLIPARANANVGIIIEPTILERDKVIVGKKPTFEPQHHTTIIDTMAYISESSTYPNYDARLNYSNEFFIDPYTQETGSYVSASAKYTDYLGILNYSDPFRVNFHTNESGSYISASAVYEDLPSSINLYDPFRVNNNTKLTGSGVIFSGEFSSIQPKYTFSELAAGSGSFVGKEFLERPALYNIGDRDYSGWYGSDYYNATIQAGSQKLIYEEVVMPRYENNVLSEFNKEEEYHYSSSLSASLHKPYSSSLVVTDLDNRWDESTGTERLFYTGCIQTDNTTDDNTPAVVVTPTSPTTLTTTDNPNAMLDV